MNILDRYGIKEVADVTFYKLGSDGNPTVPVLYLDTLKVSTIEQTAETSDARGGKGNAKLISWDYGKEITVTLEDALFSAKSMAIMFGNGKVKSVDYVSGESGSNAALIMKTEKFRATADGTSASSVGWSSQFVAPNGKKYSKINPKYFEDTAESAEATTFVKGKDYFCSYDLAVNAGVIEISADSFPGTYYVTGDTYARSEAAGEDEFFQFIVPKAKVTSENTITLEAEGDPSVFNMNLTVLRPADGIMMKLVKYELAEDGDDATEGDVTMVHNHVLAPSSSSGPNA